MKRKQLIYKNISFFIRYYKLVAVAALITIAVIVGSMAVGDSVRTTLVKRVTERLGATETIVFSRNSFMSEKLLKNQLFKDETRGILLSNGFIPHNGKLIPVNVWGVDDQSIPRGTAKMNRALLKEITGNSRPPADNHPDAIVLRLPATGLVPSGSLFVTENYTTSIRLSFEGIIDVEEGGNINLKNEQVIPLNIFVHRNELADALDVKGKVNLILTNRIITGTEFNNAWDYSASGLSVNRHEYFTEITSDRVFLQEEVVHSIQSSHNETNRLFSYLANSIGTDEASIPYSFITATDRYKDEHLSADEVILSDYAAKRLQTQAGDTIRITYFTSQNLKTLQTDTIKLVVKKIVPLAELQEDKTLSADFPGLSDVERCTDWDSDLPINMDLITDEDEKYWELYRSTPKAIIAYEAVAEKWGNAFGIATAVRVSDSDPDLSGLRAEMFGIQLISPRSAGLYAAQNGVDFSSLFLALGFFIIVSAILLMLIPLSEMFYKRRDEINLLQSLGYTRKRISGILWRESAPVVLVASLAGAVAGLLYTTIIMWLLGNVWKGATHTDGFAVYPDITTILTGFAVGTGLSLWLLRITIVRNLKKKFYDYRPRTGSLKIKKISAVLSSVLTIAMIVINLFFLHSVLIFVIVGIVMIGTTAIWGDYLISIKGTASSENGLRSGKMIWNTLLAGKKQTMLSFFALTSGVFIVFSVGLNRQSFSDSSRLRSGTGGYTLWCESSVPVYHNMNTQAGREKLSLTDLPPDTEVMQCLRYRADDASCLNLNKVTTPTVLGVEMEKLQASDFRIRQSLHSSTSEELFKCMQTGVYDKQSGTPVYPALVDETVLIWGLMMNVGDTLYYENDLGERIAIQLIGTLSNSVFQGNILMDRNLFSEIWKETTGSEVFLIKTEETEIENVKTLLSQALSEYGVIVSTTNERLRQFNTVTDTYLTIFMTLGGLGLLLGIMSFIIVIRKNLVMRRKEITLYRTLGFTDEKISRTLYRENILVPLYAIATGVVSSLVGISISFPNIGLWIWLMAIGFTVFFVLCVIIFVKKSVDMEIRRTMTSDK